MGINNKYPPEVHEWVKAHAPKMRDRMLAEECNKALGTHFTERSIKSFRGNYGYRNGKKQWTSEEYWKYQTYYPKGMIEFIRENTWGTPSKEMAEMVNAKFGTNYTPVAIKQLRQRMGLKSGVTGWFQKGRSPGTKGKTIEEICKGDPEKLARVKATWFPKGHKPANLLQIGDIVVNSDGYKLRKKKMTGTLWERWEFLHRAVWEEHNGPIQKGMVVTFKDSNRLNCDISNLMLITKGVNATLTRKEYRFSDPDLTETAANMLMLQQTAAKRRRKKQNGKQVIPERES